MLCSVCPVFADWGNIPNDASTNLAYSVAPITTHYKFNNGGIQNYELIQTQNELLDIRSKSNILESQVVYEEIECYFYTTNTFKRFDDGGVNGTINREISSPDTTYYLDKFSLPSVWGIDTTRRGTNMPVIVFDEAWRFLGTTIQYRYTVVNHNTKELVEREIQVPLTGDNSRTIYVLPVVVVADIRNSSGLTGTDYSNVIVYDYEITVNAVNKLDLSTNSSYKIVYQSRTNLTQYNGDNENPYNYAEKYNQFVSGTPTYVGEFDFTDWLADAFGFLDVELFGDFTIGGLLGVVLAISVFLAFLKIFAGG